MWGAAIKESGRSRKADLKSRRTEGGERRKGGWTDGNEIR